MNTVGALQAVVCKVKECVSDVVCIKARTNNCPHPRMHDNTAPRCH